MGSNSSETYDNLINSPAFDNSQENYAQTFREEDYPSFLPNIRHLNVGGFGDIFEATYANLLGEKGKFALKYLKSSKGYSTDIVDELISHEITYSDDYILKYYGLTQDLELNKTFIVMYLTQIHEHGLIHRDLHSKNILICKNGDQELIKIGDLGLTISDLSKVAIKAKIKPPKIRLSCYFK
ncbi:25758_t:CDS:2 [Gigaspora margarita]|uniref:25758_t:CDS:1 n=1 Tax=Gigaspora margarita TaxID=4874 RepID=A0ABN7UZB6_GIGMA|nr:25758_t:CDS:2 [Gigaspora margarita]